MKPVLLRTVLGEILREARLGRHMTLRDVSIASRVSLGYVSEVERGRKEASSELLCCLCDALDVSLAQVLCRAADRMGEDRSVSAAA